MNITERQMIAIDKALEVGCEIGINGKPYTFSPLDFEDLARVAQKRKTEQLASYIDAVKDLDIDRAQRFQDMYDIQHRAPRKEDYTPRNERDLSFMCWLSLRHTAPAITTAAVLKLLQDDGARELIANVLKIEAGLDDTGNPPEPKAGET